MATAELDEGKIQEIIKPYVKHSQSCSLGIASGDEGDFCTCDIRGRRRMIAKAIAEAFKKGAEKNGWVKLCPHSTPANKYCRECAHEKLEEEYNECDRCYDKHAKSKGYIKREDMELCEEKIAEALFNQDHLDTGQKWSDYSFGKHSEVGQGYRYRAKAIAEAKPFKEKEG